LTTVVATAEYDLPANFDGIEGPMTYAVGIGGYYPPVKVIKEVDVRRRRAAYDVSGRPDVAAVFTDTFDPTVGSRKKLLLYPTPDDVYVLSYVMTTRQTMLDASNQYPLGGEVLGPVIVAACLAAAERNFEDAGGVHSAEFRDLLASAIQADKKSSSPDTLGFDRGADESAVDYRLCQDPSLICTFNDIEWD
jgi:hypothetical protein